MHFRDLASKLDHLECLSTNKVAPPPPIRLKFSAGQFLGLKKKRTGKKENGTWVI
jgi:hypothetical protein